MGGPSFMVGNFTRRQEPLPDAIPNIQSYPQKYQNPITTDGEKNEQPNPNLPQPINRQPVKATIRQGGCMYKSTAKKGHFKYAKQNHYLVVRQQSSVGGRRPRLPLIHPAYMFFRGFMNPFPIPAGLVGYRTDNEAIISECMIMGSRTPTGPGRP
jgi:hypothetical protein